MSQTHLNVLAIFLCAVLAHVLPATTWLGAYAVLGPAHYLTEISWLHDRKYFVSRPRLWIITALAVLMIMLVRPNQPEADGVFCALLGGLVAAGLGMSMVVTVLVTAFSAGIGMAGAKLGWGFVLAVVVLVPTLIHVFAFTTMFMLAGASRTRQTKDCLPLAALGLAAASFLLLPTVDLGDGSFLKTAEKSFPRLLELLSVPGHGVALRLVGFLGFAYAYHYVNWFLKTGLLGWHRVSSTRLVLLASAWAVVMFAYAQSIVVGLLVSLPLSLGHVLLELPLNMRTVRGLCSTSFLRPRLPMA
ncbi:hypothetical protein HDE78_003694 [Rhodanobacter sp. K2T2]|uniref:hypothetical protein n=1 Tax=Rhodanobacter sp. K2T2 TaxID=2723085 RepID=UPI0015C94B20|nr:hypothetical protein [Rhodanobacter sp. K2T2]NYE30717.1 hypothetical protein [Rhodanobacter sp. K2T2]